MPKNKLLKVYRVICQAAYDFGIAFMSSVLTPYIRRYLISVLISVAALLNGDLPQSDKRELNQVAVYEQRVGL